MIGYWHNTVVCLSVCFCRCVLWPQTLHLLNRTHCCHLANTLKHTMNKRSAKISTSGIAIVRMLHSYPRQLSTIGPFSATAGLLVLMRAEKMRRSTYNLSRTLAWRSLYGVSETIMQFCHHPCLSQSNWNWRELWTVFTTTSVTHGGRLRLSPQFSTQVY